MGLPIAWDCARVDSATPQPVQSGLGAQFRARGVRAFDGKTQVVEQALGMHTAISRARGGQPMASREIRIATVFREAPADYLRMVAARRTLGCCTSYRPRTGPGSATPDGLRQQCSRRG